MPAFLVPVDSGQCLIPLEKAIVLIGRQSDCDVSLTHSRKISRKHCCIAQVNNKFVVRDLGSTNGVFLNGKRIEKEATICLGDDLVIGDVRFRMQNETQLISRNKAATALKTVDETTSAPPSVPPPIPVRNRPSFSAPPSLDIPIAISGVELEYDIEETSVNRQAMRRKKRIDDVIPLNEEEMEMEEEEDVMPLASDSF